MTKTEVVDQQRRIDKFADLDRQKDELLEALKHLSDDPLFDVSLVHNIRSIVIIPLGSTASKREYVISSIAGCELKAALITLLKSKVQGITDEMTSL